jgi:tetratricopeptide (TPR) repeat protein
LSTKNKLMDKAQKLLQKGKLKDTIAVLDQVMDADPTDFRVLLKKGELEQRVGDTAAAKESYTRVAEQYSQDGFYLKAVAIYKKILKLDGEEFHLYSKLAHLYRKLGLDSEAKKHLKVVAEYYKAKGLKTNYHEVAMQLSEMGENISDSQVEYVEKIAKAGDRDKAIEHFKNVSEKYLEAGGNILQLDALVKKMDELQIQDVEVYLIQAKTYLNAKEPKKALQVIQKAYSMEPQNAFVLEALARCFLELKQPQKTASVFSELLKIYDRNGDMKNLSRVRNDLQQINDPNSNFEKLSEVEREEEVYETVQRDESEEFIIEEVQTYNPGPKTQAPAPDTHHKIDVKEQDESLQEFSEGSFSELERDLEDSVISDVEEIIAGDSAAIEPAEESFARPAESSVGGEDSYMNIFVDAFDGTEDTVMAKQPPKAPSEATTKGPKIDTGVEFALDESDFENSSSEESSFSFQDMSSFESVLNDVAEATKIDVNMDDFSSPEKTMDSTAVGLSMSFGDAAPEETVLETAAPQKQELVDFDQFYSDGGKQEKSEISVNEEEFVSISQFIDDDSKPKIPSPPEKIEIHDRVVSSAPKKVSNIRQSSLEDQTIAADIESSIDFSNLDMSELSLNLKMPESELSNASMLEEPSIDSREVMQSMLLDPEPDTNDGMSPGHHIDLDDKTMLDLKHEFQESSKIDRSHVAAEDSFFDLAGELKDEISEFEKTFGKVDEDVEEEFLSPEEVILEFKKGVARTIDKSDFQTHYNLGVAYKEMGLLDEAISAFELSSNNPDSRIDSISMIGMCLQEKNDYETAAKLFLKTLPTMNYQDPKYLGIMYQLGEAYMSLGRHVDAYKAFAKVKDLDPSFRDAKGRVKELGFNLGIKEAEHTQQSGRIIVDMKERKKNKL